MRCEGCGSEALSFERDALLVAMPVRLEGEVLVLDTAPRPAPLDDVQVCCQDCGREQRKLQWKQWRPDQAQADAVVIEAENALDMIAAWINEPGECQGADFVEFVCRLLPLTGRQIEECDV
jgi:hypothetical protein